MNRAPAERWTLRVAAALLLSLAVCMALLALDPRALDTGDPVWLKPIRFSLAFSVQLLTMAWLARLGRDVGEPLHRAFAAGLWLQIAAAVVEWSCIALQAARGVHSHFNSGRGESEHRECSPSLRRMTAPGGTELPNFAKSSNLSA